uniref:Galectin n=1 Tax=Pectinophora gossypiella TaxID=13191 RepID=A0A1E1WT13_PECGO
MAVYNPQVPSLYNIPGGFYPGKMVRVQGSTPPGAQRFAINLQCGMSTDPRDDIALHLNFRFVERCVVRNHLTALSWGAEETAGGLPLVPGQPFEVLVLCEPHALKVALNGQHFCEFPHRIPFQRISHITFDGDVTIQMFAFEETQTQQQQYMPPPPAYGPPQGFY